MHLWPGCGSGYDLRVNTAVGHGESDGASRITPVKATVATGDSPDSPIDLPSYEYDYDCGPSAGSSIAWATWGLFVGLGILLVGVGLFATVVGVRGQTNGYSDWEIGAIGAAYYGGFLAGSKLTVGALVKVGHIRVYSAWASVLAATMIMVGLTDQPVTWIGMRFVSGLCIAGLYVVAESWLNQLASNDNRGRLLAVYMVVTSGAYGVGQVLVGQFGRTTVSAFAIAALLTSLAVVPVALSEDAAPPSVERSISLPLRQLARQVPTGLGTCLLVGITHGALVGMGVVYATRLGLTAGEAGRFVAATAVGGVLSQWPLSAASDDLDRRFVGLVAAVHAVGASVFLLIAGPEGWPGLLAMALLGAASFPLYSIASAYTNDWVEPIHANSAASQLVMTYGAGALLGPPLVSLLTIIIGDDGFPWTMVAMHVAIILFLVYRLLAWRSPLTKRPWNEASLAARAFFIPANVVWMGNRIGRSSRRRLARTRNRSSVKE